MNSLPQDIKRLVKDMYKRKSPKYIEVSEIIWDPEQVEEDSEYYLFTYAGIGKYYEFSVVQAKEYLDNTWKPK